MPIRQTGSHYEAHSVVNTSPKQFEVKDISAIGSSEITLDNLAHMSNFDKVSFSAKVIYVNNPIHVSRDKSNRMSLLSTDMGQLDSLFGKMMSESSRRIFVIQLLQFCCSYIHAGKYISLPKDGATFEEISDIGEVHQDEPADSSFTVHDGEKAGVLPFMQEEGSIYHT